MPAASAISRVLTSRPRSRSSGAVAVMIAARRSSGGSGVARATIRYRMSECSLRQVVIGTARWPEPVGNNVLVTDLGLLADRTFAAVIFDMDGTLIDSTPAVARSWRTWATEHGITPEDLLFHHGVPAAGVVAAVLPEHRHESALARINELELADVGDIDLLPGAREALDALVGATRA